MPVEVSLTTCGHVREDEVVECLEAGGCLGVETTWVPADDDEDTRHFRCRFRYEDRPGEERLLRWHVSTGVDREAYPDLPFDGDEYPNFVMGSDPVGRRVMHALAGRYGGRVYDEIDDTHVDRPVPGRDPAPGP